jgi:hypothetical protein
MRARGYGMSDSYPSKSAAEYAGFLSLELGFGQDAGLLQLTELAELSQHVIARAASGPTP